MYTEPSSSYAVSQTQSMYDCIYTNILTEVFSREGNLSYPKLTADEAFSNLKISEGLKRNFGGTDRKQNI